MNYLIDIRFCTSYVSRLSPLYAFPSQLTESKYISIFPGAKRNFYGNLIDRRFTKEATTTSNFKFGTAISIFYDSSILGFL